MKSVCVVLKGNPGKAWTAVKRPSRNKRMKRCPFCGERAIVFQIPENTPEEQLKHPNWTWNNPGMWVVGCADEQTCFGNINHKAMVFPSEKLAIETWNRRAKNNGEDVQ